MPSKTIDPTIVQILDRGILDGNSYRLPEGQLDRKTYEECNKVLVGLGAKWDKKSRAHVAGDLAALDRLRDVLASGKRVDLKQETQFFETPPALVARLMDLADVRPGMRCLEPSAGRGAIAVELARAAKANVRVSVCDNHPPFEAVLRSLGFNPWNADFLVIQPDGEGYDRIVMNPPFTRGSDVKHVLHARRFLRHDGRLVSIMSRGWQNKSDHASREFRAKVESEGEVYEVDAGAFKESGTLIPTCIVVLGAEA